MLLVFALCFVLVYSWSMLAFFNYLPGWLMYLDLWTIAGIFGYSQLFALVESGVIFLPLLLLSALLPSSFLRNRFASLGAVIVLLAAVAAAFLHFTRLLPLWPSKTLILGIFLYLSAVASASFMLNRYAGLRHRIETILDRVIVLLFLYLPFVVIGGIVVILRNLFGIGL